AEPKPGVYSISQPTINPLFSTRQFPESLLLWSGNNTTYHDYLSRHWTDNVLKGASWNKVLQDGVFYVETLHATSLHKTTGNLQAAADAISKMSGTGVEMTIYEKAGLGSGVQANNPWLQELPDPVSKV